MPADQHQVLVFDVNETLSDLAPLRGRFTDVGALGSLPPTWFAGVLRDGFALTVAGGYADFMSLAHDGLRALLSGLEGWAGDEEAAARHILDGFSQLDVHRDVPDGVRKLSDAGYRLTAMTNGSTALTERLLDKAGVLHYFEALSDVHGPRCRSGAGSRSSRRGRRSRRRSCRRGRGGVWAAVGRRSRSGSPVRRSIRRRRPGPGW